MPSRSPALSLCALLSLVAAATACDGGAAAIPKVELYIDGTLAGEAPTIDFPPTTTETFGVAVQLEIRNLGPAELLLSGSPPAVLERDDRLAFRVSQPAATRYAKGESAVISVIFAPHSPGTSVARLVIDTNARATPLVVVLSGEGIAAAGPSLVATIDGTPVGSTFDFGAVRALESAHANLRIANSGSGVLALGPQTITLSGPDRTDFAVGQVTNMSLGEGEHLDLPLTFTPDDCRSYRALLTIEQPTGDPIDVALSGRGGDNPQGHADVTDPELLDAPDVDVALSAAAPDGKRRFVVGNLTVGSFAGQVSLFAWDGCSLSHKRTISATSAGLSAQLFGHQVALSDDGATLLVTARDQLRDAWIFSIDTAGDEHFVGTLATLDEGGGHGRGAALSGDGAVAFVGQALANSGFNAHGAVFVYPRPTAGWAPVPEARFRLVPSTTTQVELVGAWVETSQNGDVVVSGALQTPVGAGSRGPAAAYVWAATDDGGERVWGQATPQGEPNERRETVRLVSAQVPFDTTARVAISADGNTIALSTAREEDVQIRIFTRSGDDLWGKPSANPDERVASATLTLTASAALRMVMDPSGEALVVGDLGGAREFARPAGGWSDDAAVGRTWNVPFYGALALASDATSFAGTDKNGAAWFVFR